MSRHNHYHLPGRHNRVSYDSYRSQPSYSNYGNYWSNAYDDSLTSRMNRRGQGNSSSRRRYYTYTMSDIPIASDNLATNRAPEPDPTKTLMVKKVDLNIYANGQAHHTSEYDMSSHEQIRPKLVVRRGQLFNMTVQFNKPYDPSNDDLRLIFQAGQQPVKSKGTHVEVLLSAADENKKWGAKILSNQGNELTVSVFTPPSLYIGKWNLSIEVVEKAESDNFVYSYEHPDPIYIIFNPWCKDDGVFLDNEVHLGEYILNESGCIFSGSSTKITSKPWNFGQFEAFVLDVALYLLEAGGMKWNVRGNPIAVARKLTAMVNSSDDGGVLIGNWSGDYSGGRSPLSWTGSPAILKRYWLDKRPVRFGQCWVFSGITTTIMRAIGIPARSVTNFKSAHDTDGSITIDYHFHANGEADTSLNEDSVWNFHVWNEVWMSRPDLPQGFGGWQVVDATPQEASDGVYVCGPVSLHAIKQGEVNLPYDAPFVFAEVNADYMYWVTDMYGILSPRNLKKNVVGKYISTKACNSSEREDVTLNYKPPEDSAEERAAVMRANQTGSTREGIYGILGEDVTFSVEQDSERTWVGQDFVVALRISNMSSKTRTINGRVVVKTMFYTGVTCEKVKSEPLSNTNIVLKAGKEYVHKAVVKASDYMDLLRDCCMLDVTFWAHVNETKQVFTSKDDFRLRKPHLIIKAPKEAETGKQFMVELSFVNPLDKTLTECVVEVDGLSKDLSFPQGNVSAKGTFSTSLPVTASKKGQKELVIIFSSKQIEDINGSHPIYVKAV